MKKLFLSIIAIASVATANAQMRFGGELGLNMSNVSVSPSPGTSPSMAIGARVGALMDYSFNDNWAFQPGIYFSMMGYKIPGTSETVQGITISSPDFTMTLNYIHIPLNIVYRMDAGPGKFFVAAGPYLGYGISGTEKTSAVSYTVAGQTVSEPATSTSVKFGSDSSSVKALDFGVGVNVGYELPMGLFFRAGYDLGLANMSNTSGETVKNTCIHISVGYFFGNKQ